MYRQNELMHYGVLGMKWGHHKARKEFSAKATGYRAMSKVYGANEKVYSKINKNISRINGSVKEKSLRMANKAQAEANTKARSKMTQKQAEKESKQFKRDLRDTKQAEWKRVRRDYNSTKTTGRHVVNLLLNGAFGSYTYNSLRAAGNSRLKSEAITVVSRCLGPLGSAAAATIVGSNYKDKNL